MEIKGEKRDNLTLPEYKAVMKKVEELEEVSAKLDIQNSQLEQKQLGMKKFNADLQEQIQDGRNETEELTQEKLKIEDAAKDLQEQLKMKKIQYTNIENQLIKMKTSKKDIERNVHIYHEKPEWQLPEPGLLMSAKDFRNKMALPLVQRLKDVIIDLTIRCVQAMQKVDGLQKKNGRLQSELTTLKTRIDELRQKEKTLEYVKEYIGENKVASIEEAAVIRKQREQILRHQINKTKHKDQGMAM